MTNHTPTLLKYSIASDSSYYEEGVEEIIVVQTNPRSGHTSQQQSSNGKLIESNSHTSIPINGPSQDNTNNALLLSTGQGIKIWTAMQENNGLYQST